MGRLNITSGLASFISNPKLISVTIIIIDSANEEPLSVHVRYSARQCKQPLTLFIQIDRITNQRFGYRRSRFDNTFKGNGVPVESK